jgi:hypothetical protein
LRPSLSSLVTTRTSLAAIRPTRPANPGRSIPAGRCRYLLSITQRDQKLPPRTSDYTLRLTISSKRIIDVHELHTYTNRGNQLGRSSKCSVLRRPPWCRSCA